MNSNSHDITEILLKVALSTIKQTNKFRATGGHIQITIMIDTQQQYIKLNIRGEISIIVLQAHSDRKRT
jgi:hypothetical protein